MQATIGCEGEKDLRMVPSAQSYLSYQGDKFIDRFDANCYIALTHKLDMHDVSRSRVTSQSARSAIKTALSMITQPTLILGIKSDILFPYTEQEELCYGIRNSTLKTIESDDGHDGFLLETEQVNRYILDFLHQIAPKNDVKATIVGGISNGNPLVRVGYKESNDAPPRRKIEQLFKQARDKLVWGA